MALRHGLTRALTRAGLLGVAASAAMAVGAAPAQAAVNYCVNVTPCPDNGQAKPTIDSAISATPHADEIDIGPGTYSPISAGSGFHIPDGRNITFIGSGRSQTILTASGTPPG